MPRTTSITSEDRTQAFLAWRRGGRKVYPIAKQFQIARSTLSGIVQEFLDQGFSDRPRANVSQETLLALQTAHLEAIHQQLAPEEETSPFDLMEIRKLDLTSATNEANAQDLLNVDPLPVSAEFLWHLRETSAARIIQEARGAAQDFHCRDLESWQALRQDLEAACRLQVIEDSEAKEKPHLMLTIVSQIRNSFFDPTLQEKKSPGEWITWSRDRNVTRYLLANGQRAAVGTEDDHQQVRNGVDSFLRNAHQEHRTRFREIERLRRDLALLQDLLNEALRAVTREQIHSGICPACPYPEGLQPSSIAAAPKKGNTSGRERRL